jgi:UDP-N-acetyl-D-glucosamine dehydrogenase
MPYNVVEAIAEALNSRRKSLNGSRILVMGVAYKKDVDDLRESPSLKIIELLTARGAEVDYNDPYFAQLFKMRHYDYSHKRSVPIDAKSLASFDCVVIATDHTSYDYAAIVESAQLVVDTRNATRRLLRHRERIVLC